MARAQAASVPRVAVATRGHHPMAWVSLVAVYFLWGSTYPAIRVAVETIPPLLMAGVRYTLAGAILLPIALRFGDRDGDRPGRAQWLAAGIFGLALVAGGNGALSWGEQSVPAGTAALLVATVSLWMVLIDRVFNRVLVGAAGAAGLLIGFAGVGLLVNPSTSAVDPAGASVILLGALSWASGSVYSRSAAMPRRALVGTGMAMLVGGTGLLVAAGLGGEMAALDLAEVSAESVLGLLWLIGPGAILGFSAYTFALHSLPTSTVATYAYVNPAVAVVLGGVLLGEALTARTLAAGALIVAAVALILATRGRVAAKQARATEDRGERDRATSDGTAAGQEP